MEHSNSPEHRNEGRASWACMRGLVSLAIFIRHFKLKATFLFGEIDPICALSLRMQVGPSSAVLTP